MKKNHKTAIHRNRVSRPFTRLMRDSRLKGRVLDYGCGLGYDCDWLKIEGWDPHFRPAMPEGKFDTIMCNYVLCILDPGEEASVLLDIAERLEPDGVAYITVRNDVKKDEKMPGGWWRRKIDLPLPLIYSTKDYKTYILENK